MGSSPKNGVSRKKCRRDGVRRQKKSDSHPKFETTRVKSIKKGPSRTKLTRESPREKIVMNTP